MTSEPIIAMQVSGPKENAMQGSVKKEKMQGDQEKKTSINPWREYCMKYLKEHPEIKNLKEAMRAAKESGGYTKVKKVKKTGPRKPNSWMEFISQWKKDNPSWKDQYSYKQVLVLCKDAYKKRA